MNTRKLDAVERRVMEAIDAHQRRHDMPPTMRELVPASGYASAGSLLPRLRRMRERGLIDFQDGAPRSLRVVRPTDHELLQALLLALSGADLRRLPTLQADAIERAMAAAAPWCPVAPQGGTVCPLVK